MRPPLQWLGLAAVLELAGLVLGALARDRPALAVTGWVLGGLGAIGCLAAFTVQDSKRRTDPWYDGSTAAGLLRAGLALAAVAVVALASWQFADWASRR